MCTKKPSQKLVVVRLVWQPENFSILRVKLLKYSGTLLLCLCLENRKKLLSTRGSLPKNRKQIYNIWIYKSTSRREDILSITSMRILFQAQQKNEKPSIN